MRRIALPVTLLTISLFVLGSFVIGSFKTYSPEVDAVRMQNMYLSRILFYGFSIALLNGLAIAFLIASRKTE